MYTCKCRRVAEQKRIKHLWNQRLNVTVFTIRRRKNFVLMKLPPTLTLDRLSWVRHIGRPDRVLKEIKIVVWRSFWKKDRDFGDDRIVVATSGAIHPVDSRERRHRRHFARRNALLVIVVFTAFRGVVHLLVFHFNCFLVLNQNIHSNQPKRAAKKNGAKRLYFGEAKASRRDRC